MKMVFIGLVGLLVMASVGCSSISPERLSRLDQQRAERMNSCVKNSESLRHQSVCQYSVNMRYVQERGDINWVDEMEEYWSAAIAFSREVDEGRMTPEMRNMRLKKIHHRAMVNLNVAEESR